MTNKAEEIDKKVKGFVQSKTIWGIFVAALPTISGWLGFDLQAEGLAIWDGIIEIVGTGLAIYGRITANTKIVRNKFKKKQ